MVKISVVIITLNEERNIKRCIDSVYDIADEIIVVDSNSTDKTEEVCLKFDKLTFVKKAWQGFSKTKNHAMELCKNNLILSIDADEALSPELKNSIKKINNINKQVVYKVNRLTNYCGSWIKHSGWYPDSKIRIFNKQTAEWDGEIHEELKFNIKPEIKLLKGDLLHYSYYTISEHILRSNKYSDISAQNNFNNNKNINIIKVLTAPLFKFFRNYVLKLGFLDGYKGFVICIITAHETFLKYAKTKELFKSAK